MMTKRDSFLKVICIDIFKRKVVKYFAEKATYNFIQKRRKFTGVVENRKKL